MDNQASQTELHTWLNYVAFDKFPTDKLVCKRAIARVYEDDSNRYFNDRDDMLEHYGKDSFDIVVMCNVLHEISPSDWINTFKQDSLMNKLLSDSGSLLIVEDALIPSGELPNKDGFFLLGTTELKTLFCIEPDDSCFISRSYNNENRLFAHLIPHKYLGNISDASIKNALESLKDKCCDEIKKLRGQDNFKSGRLLGLWLQQLANSVIYLEQNTN